MLRKFIRGDGFQIAFGNQTIFLPALSWWTKEEDSRLCVPTSRQVCLFGAFKDQLVDPGNQGGQTELNNLNPKLSTVILKGFVAADHADERRPICVHPRNLRLLSILLLWQAVEIRPELFVFTSGI